jgi:hypothetical protein
MAWLGGALAVGCGGPSVGDIESQAVTLQVSGVYLGPRAIAAGDERGDVTMARALLSVDGMTLTPCAAGAGAIAIDPRIYDLLADPPLGETVTTAVSEFCTLRVDLGPSPDLMEDASAESLVLEAQDETGAKLNYVGEDSPSLTFTADRDTTFGAQPLLLGFDLSVWLAYLADSTTDPSPGPFDSTLLDAAALYVDGNGNGALDDDEQTPVAHATASR